jgi:riboflavin synthase
MRKMGIDHGYTYLKIVIYSLLLYSLQLKDSEQIFNRYTVPGIPDK